MVNRKDNTNEILLSWQEIENNVEQLASKILKDYKPEIVVVLAEGAWAPGSLLKKYLPARYLSFGCKNYDKNDNKLPVVEIYQFVPGQQISGKNVLIFDEVCDSGETLQTVTEEINKQQPSELKTAVLYLKDHSAFKPSYWVKNIKDSWLIYPWE